MLRLRGPPSFVIILRQVWEEDIAGKGEGKRDDAVDDEQPSPASFAMDAIEVGICCGLQKPAEELSQGTGQPKYHSPLSKLAWSVPAAEKIVDTWVET